MADPMLNDPQRGSGRTTRMLAEAARLEADGRSVYIVAANEAHRRILANRFEELHGKRMFVHFETPASLGPAWDWEFLKIRGAHRSCEVLVDHHTIETHLSPVLRMLHRFDAPERPDLRILEAPRG